MKADHRTIENLFGTFEKVCGDARKHEIAYRICVELKIHTKVEEKLFYPAIRGKTDDDMRDEVYVEYDGAKALINEIEASDPDADFYDAKVTVLPAEIKHHVREEKAQSEGMFA